MISYKKSLKLRIYHDVQYPIFWHPFSDPSSTGNDQSQPSLAPWGYMVSLIQQFLYGSYPQVIKHGLENTQISRFLTTYFYGFLTTYFC